MLFLGVEETPKQKPLHYITGLVFGVTKNF